MDELNKYSKSNPFKVPDNYFEDFNHQLMKKIDDEENKSSEKWKIRSLKPFLAIAAGFLILFSIWFMFLGKLGSKEMSANNETHEEALFGYFASIDTDELIHMISDEEFNNADFALNLEQDIDFIIDDLDESMIIEEIEDLNTIDEI